MTTVTRQQHNFLCDLRDSGVCNMFGAAPYLQVEFGLSSAEAQDILITWMKGPRHSRIEEEHDESI